MSQAMDEFAIKEAYIALQHDNDVLRDRVRTWKYNFAGCAVLLAAALGMLCLTQ